VVNFKLWGSGIWVKFRCRRLATSPPWCVSNRSVHEDLEGPFFRDHIRALTEDCDSKLAGVGEPLVR
jgi:hypothetical protein